MGACRVLLVFLFSVVGSLSQELEFPPPRPSVLGALFKSYDARESPFGETEAARADVSVSVLAVRPFNADKMEFSVDLQLHLRWRDPRLVWQKVRMTSHRSFSRLSLPRKRTWLPRLLLLDARSSLLSDAVVLQDADGTLLRSQRVSATVPCLLAAEMFPLDRQRCSLWLRSPDVELKWEASRPVSSPRPLLMPGFRPIDRLQPVACGERSSLGCLDLHFNFSRRPGAHLAAYYLPSLLAVSLTWASFWLEERAMAARMSLSAIAFALLTAQLMVAGGSVVSALHVWLTGCLAFPVYAVWEACAVSALDRRRRRRRGGGRKEGRRLSDAQEGGKEEEERDDHIADVVSRILCPVAFLIFNLFYWLYFGVLASKMK